MILCRNSLYRQQSLTRKKAAGQTDIAFNRKKHTASASVYWRSRATMSSVSPIGNVRRLLVRFIYCVRRRRFSLWSTTNVPTTTGTTSSNADRPADRSRPSTTAVRLCGCHGEITASTQWTCNIYTRRRRRSFNWPVQRDVSICYAFDAQPTGGAWPSPDCDRHQNIRKLLLLPAVIVVRYPVCDIGHIILNTRL